MKYQMVLGLTGLVAVSAHPQPRQAPNDNVAIPDRGVDISKYAMPSVVSAYTKTSKVKTDKKIASLSSDYVETAKSFVKTTFPELEFRTVDDAFVGTNGVGHVNFKQTVHGLDIDNADFHVNVKDGKIFSHGNSFFTGSLPEESPLTKRAIADPVDALKGAIDTLSLPVKADNAVVEHAVVSSDSENYKFDGTSGTASQPEARLVYLNKGGDEGLKLAWRVETDTVDNWLLSYVDATDTTKIHGIVDYVSDIATYEVYPWNVIDPTEGERKVLEDPWLLETSEFTWHSDGSKNYTTTQGNNGWAQVNPTGGSGWVNNYRPNSPDLTFEYPYSLQEADPTKYRDASITQLFYTANKLHDLLYLLGFTEKAGNFETNNNNQGGTGNDYVILQAQDGSGKNNAMFSTPPDGRNGRMTMYLWDKSQPQRDCSFDASVVIHEYVHGLSNRLTGGPANSACLSGAESGGMGEGWSDFFPTAIRLKPTDTRKTDHSMGDWVFNNPAGIRQYPYSTSLTTNPLTYRNVDDGSGVHAQGTVWASILYEVLWNLIDKHGKNDDDFPTFGEGGIPSDGKFLAMKLVLDGLALQPCNPTFISARDAIIDADVALTGGDNKCEIWNGFAKRGMGVRAGLVSGRRTEDYTAPAGC